MGNIQHYKGLTQSDYQKDKAVLKEFEPIESNWKNLFHWVLSAGRTIVYYDKDGKEQNQLTDLWEDHILTILIEILQTDVEKYKTQFILQGDTDSGKETTQTLKERIESWKKRIRTYINKQMMRGEDLEKNPAVQVARLTRKQLEEAVPDTTTSPSQEQTDNYAMLKAIRSIKEKENPYIQSIEKSGDMDGALSLLLIFIRNYSGVIKKFNDTFSSLPGFYHRNILMSSLANAIQDRTLLVITSAEPAGVFTLPAQTAFLAGKKEDETELVYRTEKEEPISGVEIKDVFAVFQVADNETRKRSFYEQEIKLNNPHEPTPLFEKSISTDYPCGWMLESKLFVLEEGKRTIQISFTSIQKQNEESVNDSHIASMDDFFLAYVTDAWGWSAKKCNTKFMPHSLEKVNTDNEKVASLVLEITINENDPPLAAATEELHQKVSEFPIIKILANNQESPYEWASSFNFSKVNIDLDVQHLHHFEVYNEFGEIDASQPFYPFGTQGERGAWFRFGNKEMAQKELKEVTVSGSWSKIPSTMQGFTEQYKEYPDNIGYSSFQVKSEWQKNGKWNQTVEKLQPIFKLEAKKDNNETNQISEKVDIRFNFRSNEDSLGRQVYQNPPALEFTREEFVFLRVTLDAPEMGFGTEMYRKLFAEKVSKQEEVPHTPVIPVLSDMELSYKASGEIDLLNEKQDHSILLSRVTALSEYDPRPVWKNEKEVFISESKDEHLLYFGFSHTLYKKTIRMYVDLAFVKKEKTNSLPDNSTHGLQWEYRKNKEWTLLESKNIVAEDTCGFTESGYIEIEFDSPISEQSLDTHSVFWLRAHFPKDISDCLPLRAIYTDCIEVVSENGNGASLPARTITQLQKENQDIKSLFQPLPGYGGKAEETEARSSVRQSHRIAHRNRAVSPTDYEQLILERFPEIEKACCIPLSDKSPDTAIVLFSYTENNKFPLIPTWKLNNIKNYLSGCTSPWANIKVINPSYEPLQIKCIATTKIEIIEGGEAMRRMVNNINAYFAPWLQEHTFPELGKQFSGKTLHSLLANDKDVVKVYELKVKFNEIEREIKEIDIHSADLCISGKKPWSVLVPEIELELLLSNGGIGKSKIECNFIIKPE